MCILRHDVAPTRRQVMDMSVTLVRYKNSIRDAWGDELA